VSYDKNVNINILSLITAAVAAVPTATALGTIKSATYTLTLTAKSNSQHEAKSVGHEKMMAGSVSHHWPASLSMYVVGFTTAATTTTTSLSTCGDSPTTFSLMELDFRAQFCRYSTYINTIISWLYHSLKL